MPSAAKGTEVIVTITFYTDSTKTTTLDPSAVLFRAGPAGDPTGALVSYVFGVDPNLIHVGILNPGQYQATFVPNAAATWTVSWKGTGPSNYSCVTEDALDVFPTALF